MSNFKRFLTGRKSVINSETAPEDKTAIWIKNNSIKAYGNKGWKSLKSGSDEGGGDTDYSPEAILKNAFNGTIRYPIEFPKQNEESSLAYYGIENPQYHNFGTSTIYIIGKYNSGIPTIPNYMLLKTIDLSIEGVIEYICNYFTSSLENGSYQYDNRCEILYGAYNNSCIEGIAYYSGYNSSSPREDPEQHDYMSVDLRKYDVLSNEDFPDSVILDTEYNTTKYPERIHQDVEH